MVRRGTRVVGWLVLALVMAVSLRGQAPGPVCDPDAPRANLDLTLADLDGHDVALDAYKGKVILLDFWATWCGPCKFEIPHFIELYSSYRSRGFQVVGIAVDDEVPALRRYAEQMKMNYPIVLGRDDVLDAFPAMPGLPTTFIIDRDGRICHTHTGLTEKDTFEREIRALL